VSVETAAPGRVGTAALGRPETAPGEGARPYTEAARERVYLHPGNSYLAMVPTIVTTILGSCVSVCLWDESLAIGGLTHYLLARPGTIRGSAERFGTTAIRQLVDQLRQRGARHLTAKVFGGSSMNSALAATGRDLGTQNAIVAMETLRELAISIAASDTGGASGRKLLFHTDDGAAFVKYLDAKR
jgi:chemotaxis protein CheD